MSSSSPPDPAPEQVPAAAVELFGPTLDQAAAYAQLLCDEGIEWGLIGPREAPRIWSRHVAHCALLAELVPVGARVVDVGSGAGLPGIPLAILRPDLAVTLLEPLARRVRFLELAVDRLGLDNAKISQTKANLHARDDADVVTARAVAPLTRLGEWTLPLLKRGGLLLSIRGESAAAEAAAAEGDLTRLGAADVNVQTIERAGLEPLTVVSARRVSRETGRMRRSL